MGQQQLLLLTLGIIVVGTATVAGIQVFDEAMQRARTDAEMLKMLEMASRAQAWKATPRLLGGGMNGRSSDFSSFKVGILGLAPSGGPSSAPFVDIPGAGCFRFFSYDDHLRINSLNEDCVIGSWTKGILISGTSAEDITWEYRTN